MRRIALVSVFGRCLYPQTRKAQRTKHLKRPEPDRVDSVVANLETKGGGKVEGLWQSLRVRRVNGV